MRNHVSSSQRERGRYSDVGTRDADRDRDRDRGVRDQYRDDSYREQRPAREEPERGRARDNDRPRDRGADDDSYVRDRRDDRNRDPSLDRAGPRERERERERERVEVRDRDRDRDLDREPRDRYRAETSPDRFREEIWMLLEIGTHHQSELPDHQSSTCSIAL